MYVAAIYIKRKKQSKCANRPRQGSTRMIYIATNVGIDRIDGARSMHQ